jgi:hypothetical protein
MENLISRTEAQRILGVKSPITFWLRVARAGVAVAEKRVINNVTWHFYRRGDIEGLVKIK